ncbi:MAG: ABC transporter permease [Rickettsiales bacterium]
MNVIGTWTLYRKEVMRFLKVYNQTLLAPMVTALLYLAIFSLALGRHVSDVNGIHFGAFMASGLIAMSAIQNAFANTSSSVTMGKVLGTIVDYLMPPLSPVELIIGLTGAALTRGVAVGLLTAAATYVFVPFMPEHPFVALGFLFLSSLLMGAVGLLAGVVADTFDQMAAVTSYVVAPLALLSGTFYPIRNLPPVWYEISHYNPVFYMIDGLRFGITGHAETDPVKGAVALVGISVFLCAVAYVMLRKGYRLKG